MRRALIAVLSLILLTGCAGPMGTGKARAPDMAGAKLVQAVFACGGEKAFATFDVHGMALTMGGQSYDLEPAIAASGAKYESAAGVTPHMTFWNKGPEATVTKDGVFLPVCTQVVDAPAEGEARGPKA